MSYTAIVEGDAATPAFLNAIFTELDIEAADASFTAAVAITGDLTLNGNTFVTNNNGLVVGHTAQVSIGGLSAELEILGTAAADSAISLGRWSADVEAPSLRFYKSRHATIGSFDDVTSGDQLGEIIAYGDDGTDDDTLSSAIIFDTVDTIATGQVPGIIRLQIAEAGTLTDGLTLAPKATVSKVSITTPTTVAGTGLMVTSNSQVIQEIMRDSSSARFKENVKDAEIDVDAVLSINARAYDREGVPGLGFIVEDFHDAGFGIILAYDDEGPAGFLEFGRGITTLHHAVLQSYDERIKKLEAK